MDDLRDAPTTDALVESGDDTHITPEREERLSQVWDMRIRGLSIRAIAESLSVTPRTIYRDMSLLGQKYREAIVKANPIDIIADSVHFLDEMERIALYEVSNAEKKAQSFIDNKTGRTVRIEVMDPNKSKFFAAALDARKMKLKLLTDTRIIPSDPEGMFKSLEQFDEREEKFGGEERTPEEVRESITRLLKHGRRMQ